MGYFKRVVILALLSFSTIIGWCQKKGVQFEEGLNWQQIQVKAKAEGKYVFVDCYATWCGPCKAMDQKVYPTDSVGEFMNAHFISIRVQMDTSKGDSEGTKAWYADAAAIRQKYQVNAFPAYLFYSPEGNVVHVGIGYKPSPLFIRLGREALNPKRQYFTLLNNYKNEQRDPAVMPYLVKTAGLLNDKATASAIAQEYTSEVLLHLSPDTLYSKHNIQFIYYCLANSLMVVGDKGFSIFYGHEDKVNKVMDNPRYAQGIIEWSISQAEIYPQLFKGKEGVTDKPSWSRMQSMIKNKYGKTYAEHIIANVKIKWYEWKKDWPQLIKSTLNLMGKYGDNMNYHDLNDNAWTVFLYDMKKEDLKAAVSWIQRALQLEPNSPVIIDTYANLLYKLGERHECMIWEEKAVKLAPEKQDIQLNFTKMKKDEPTWSSE